MIYSGPEFIIVIRQNEDEKTIEIAGFGSPSTGDKTPPCHLVGAWIAKHFEEILKRVEEDMKNEPPVNQ